MAIDFRATAQLNIETLTDKAQSDILALSELMNRKLNPETAGEFSPTQNAALEQGIAQRAADLTAATGSTVTPEQVKQTLQDISRLEQELILLFEKREAAAARSAETEKESLAILEEQKKLKDKANDLLGIQADNWREINKAARAVLADENSTPEQKQNAQAVLDLYKQQTKEVQKLSRANKQNNIALDELTAAQKSYLDKAEEIKQTVMSIAATEDERTDIQKEFLNDIEKHLKFKKLIIDAEKESKRLTEAEARAKKEIAEVEGDIKDTFAGKITSAFLYYQALNAVKRVVREAIRTITELDRALTDIAVVTSFTRDESWALLGTYQEMAKQVGLTTTEVANLSIAFFRQGREAKDALELTRVAAEFAKIAAINVNDAANFLTAAINGFNLSASDATRIIDRFAALGAGAAASAQEIAIALSKVAPAAASAGVEVDTLMAFVTKGIETTREAPENIGTAFKTIFARMRQLTDIGTTIEDGVNVNRVEDSLKSIGVELRDANGFFRDLDDVLIDVGKRWDSINRNQQAYIATTLAGTRQQTRLIALFEDFDRTLELIEISQQSAGAAAIQHAEFMTGLEAATTRLRTSFQQLITSFVSSDVVIGAINIINGGLELLNTTVGKIVLTLGTLLMSFNLLVKSTKLKEFAGNFLLSLTKSTAKGVSSIHLLKVAIKEAGLGFSFLARNVGQLNPLINKFFLTLIKQGPIVAMQQTMNKIATTIMNTGFATRRLIPLYERLTGTTIANTAAAKANTIAWLTNPILWKAAAVTAFAVGFTILVKRIRDANDTTSKLTSAWKQFFDNIGRAIANFFKAIGDLIKKVVDFFRSLPDEVKLAINVMMLFINPITALIGAFNIATDVMDKLGISLQQPVSKAASEMRVLNNQVKDLNKNISEARREAGKLENALETFEKLQNIVFKTRKETEDLIVAQEALQEILGINLSGSSLQIFARGELARQQRQIQEDLAEVERLTNEFFAENDGVNWEKALASEQFEEFLDIVPLYAQQYAMNMIEGFEDKAPEVQEAILAAIAVDPAAVLNLFQGIGSMAADGVIIGAGVTALPESPQVTATRYAQALEQASNIVTMANIDFAEAVRMAQEMNLSDLDETTLNSVNLILPQLETLRNLSMQTAEDIASAGGTAVFNQIQPIIDALSNVDGAVFQDIVDRYNATLTDGDVLRTAEEQQEEFLNRLIALATSPEPIEAFRKAYEESIILDDAGNIIGANFQGIEIVGAEAANAFLVGFENIITDFSIPTDRLQLLVQDYEKVSEIIKKNPATLTNEDVEILSRYSGLFQDYMNGTLKPTSEYFADITGEILDGVEATREQIGESKRLLAFKLMSGQIDQESYDQQMEQLDLAEATNNLMAERLNFQNEDVDAIKSQIAAYKDSFEQAKKIRDLQKEAVALTEKSIQAIRTGATGTIEAEFNRAKLNQEIADANRQLEQNLIMAQLEAQQKVLEDAQQRRIMDITDKNTEATAGNTLAINALGGIMQAFLTSDNTITIGTGAGAVTMSIEEYMEQFNQWLAINGTS